MKVTSKRPFLLISPGRRQEKTIADNSIFNHYSAQVIRKLIDGQDVEDHLTGLPDPWKEIGRNIASCPKSPTLRAQAFEASITALPEVDSIRQMVFAADLKADLIETSDLVDQVNIPPLPSACRITEADSESACPWLDAYIAFSRKWSPRGFDGYHESCGLWLLSTIAARRILVHLGKPRFTSLYIALIARTSAFAKSTTASVALDTLQKAGLGYLLMADNSTPQKFLADMKVALPEDYSDMDDNLKEFILKKLAFAGQRGWYYEEFGQGIAAMMRRDGPMADFRGLLRRFDDTPDSYESGTIGRGNDLVKDPYLALLVNMTPPDLAPFAQRGSSLWGDGFLARFALITPPRGAYKRGRFPEGERIIPASLLDSLQAWHKRLGIPTVELKETKGAGKDGKGISMLRVDVSPVNPVCLELTKEVLEAFYAYDDGLNEACSKINGEDLDGNYARLSEKALRISTLFASISGSEKVEMKHWARAQAITEQWRIGFHNLHQQVNKPQPSGELENEERILRIIRKLNGPSLREIRQYTKLPTRIIQGALEGLIEAEIISKETTGRTTKYTYLEESGI